MKAPRLPISAVMCGENDYTPYTPYPSWYLLWKDADGIMYGWHYIEGGPPVSLQQVLTMLWRWVRETEAKR